MDQKSRIGELLDEVPVHFGHGEHDAALGLAEEATRLAREAGDTALLGVCMGMCGSVHFLRGNPAAAEPLFDEALDLIPEEPEGNHAVAVLSNIAEFLRESGRLRQAEALFRRTLPLMEKRLGPASPHLAVALTNLAYLLDQKQDFAGAEPLYERALAIREAALAEGDPLIEASRMSLESCRSFASSFATTEAAFAEIPGFYARYVRQFGKGPLTAEAYRRALGELATSGEASAETARFIAEAGQLSMDRGEIGMALERFRGALAMFEQTGSTESPEYSDTLNALAQASAAAGQFADAESLQRRSLELRQRLLGEEHPSVAQCLNNLGEIYRAVGSNDAAFEHYMQALGIWRKTLGDRSEDYARALNNLGLLYLELRNPYAAEPLLEHALDIFRERQGDDGPDTVRHAHNLAACRRSWAPSPGAAPPIDESATGFRKAMGERHPSVGLSLLNVAGTVLLEQPEKAEEAAREAIEILRDSAGYREQLIVGHTLLAQACIQSGRTADAVAPASEAMRLETESLSQIFRVTSEQERVQHARDMQRRMGLFLALALLDPRDPATVGLAVDLVLGRKGALAELWLSLRNPLGAELRAAVEPGLAEWRSLHAAISRIAAQRGRSRELDAEARLLQDRKERLERELGAYLPHALAEQPGKLARAVAGAIPDDAVLLDYLQIPLSSVPALLAEAGYAGPDGEPSHARYVAAVISPRFADTPRLVELGDADEIDSLVRAVRQGVTGERDPAAAPVDAEADGGARPAVRLRERIWDRLEIPAEGVRRVIVSPDGELTRLPFELLPLGDGEMLIDRFTVSYASTARDVLIPRSAAASAAAPCLVVADPDYDLAAPPGPLQRSGGTRRAGGELRFERLEGARGEGAAVAAMLGVEPLTGGSALESTVRAHHSPPIMHLATHGFFFSNDAMTEVLRGGTGGATATTLEHFLNAEDPMARAGLALAGVNTWMAGGDVPPEVEDGMLTAADVRGLDLGGTQLVVLSACDTGLGEVHSGEGVFGFRRAFVLAGAHTVVMSLWKVPDEQTRALMEEYYRRILAGEPRAGALREAQLALRARDPHPVNWGGFICQGDPGPLAGFAPPAARPG